MAVRPSGSNTFGSLSSTSILDFVVFGDAASGLELSVAANRKEIPKAEL